MNGAIHVVDADKETLPLATVCLTVQGEEIHNEQGVDKPDWKVLEARCLKKCRKFVVMYVCILSTG